MGETRPENLKQMIRDTLLLVCRQGIDCDIRFAVHAVIGVTVDDDQSFYVHIDENVQRDGTEDTPPSGVRPRRTSTRKRNTRVLSEGATSPKRILLSEWVSKGGKAAAVDEEQSSFWNVVKVKTEQKDDDLEDMTAGHSDDDENRATLAYSSVNRDSSNVTQNKLHHMTCVPLFPEPIPVVTVAKPRKKTAAHTKRYRERLRQDKDKWEAYLASERERKKRYRQFRQQTETQAMKDARMARRNQKDRERRHRQKMEEQQRLAQAKSKAATVVSPQEEALNAEVEQLIGRVHATMARGRESPTPLELAPAIETTFEHFEGDSLEEIKKSPLDSDS